MSSPLFIRSVYTLLSSLCHIRGIISKCKEYQYDSVALVDKNVLSGAMPFYKACQNENIKAIFGMEIDININDRIHSIVLMAKNDDGFKNLMALSTYINTISDNKIINKEILDKYKEDNFIILESDNMPLRIAINRQEDINEALNLQEKYFGKDYLVGLVDHDFNENKNNDIDIKKYLKERNIITISLMRTFYLNKEDYKEYEILRCIDEKRIIENIDDIYDCQRYFYSKEELDNLYDQDDLLNTDILASKCNVEMNFMTSLPEYTNNYGVSSKEYLINICKTVLNKKFNNQVPKEYKERLKEELNIITKMNFEDYFLIVYDFILYAKKNNILVGPGRGSAAGSLVSYCLGITEIDPLKYGLLFERFLNPERISMPDIDTDFPDDKRDEVINYVKEKYGLDHVAHIITYGTLKAKQVLRDVGRVLNYRPKELDQITKLIPFDANSPMTLDRAFETVIPFKKKISSEERYQRLFEIARKLEGNPRHESTHAAGIIMSKKPLNEIIPLIKVENDLYSSQYTMEYLEELGLIKMDFLGIRNLSIIAEVINNINDHNFDIRKIPLNDIKTFELIRNTNTLGVFQLESQGMKSLVKRMKPRNFDEIIMTIALFRPGPMENIPQFLENRNHPEKVNYIHEDIRDILEETYGIIIYQEQIMSIARKMAGFSYGKADILRKAMSKKKLKELESLREDFINGCLNNGYDKELSEEIYELILRFANYGFNKSHAAAYALIAYQMAYLKANYPAYFYKAVLNGVIGSETKTYEYINEYLSLNEKIKGISINNSTTEYLIIDNQLLMPLQICKDVGKISAEKIIEERNNNGKYLDFIDTIQRLINVGIDKNVIENLIYAGAFDELKLTRNTMIKALPNVLMYASSHKNEISLMAELDDKPNIINYPDNKTILADNEKAVLGFYFSFNPISEIKKTYNIDTRPLNELAKNLGKVKGFGLITRIKRHVTNKTHKAMAFIDIVDETGTLNLVIMPDLYAIFETKLLVDSFISFEGIIEKEDSCLVKKINIFEEDKA